MNKVIIIGGGAAGFFTAINAKEQNPNLDITILEKGNDVLQKVKISEEEGVMLHMHVSHQKNSASSIREEKKNCLVLFIPL